MKVNIYFSTLLCHTLNNCQQKVGIGGPNGRTSCPCAVPLDFFAVVNSRSVCVSFIIISLLPNLKFQLTVDKDGHSYFATLEIKNVTVEDAGKYKVTAKNELGESNATISLNFDSKYNKENFLQYPYAGTSMFYGSRLFFFDR